MMFQIVLTITIFSFSTGLYQQLGATQVVRPVPKGTAELQRDFFTAIMQEDIPKLRDLLVAHAAINMQDEEGATPLLFAVRREKLPIVHFLLNQGADPNIPNKNHKTPLYYAVLKGYVPEVAALLSHGADATVLQQNTIQNEPLLLVLGAIAHQNTVTPGARAFVKSLQEAGTYEAMIEAYQKIYTQLKKHLHGLVRVAIKEAVGGVVTPQERPQPGHTAEDIIADITQSYLMPDPLKDERLFKLLDADTLSHRDKQQIKHLIEEGASLEAHTPAGETVLMLLLKKHEYDLARLCVEMGANIEAADKQGNSVFSYLFNTPTENYDKQAGRARTRADYENPEKQRVFTILFGPKKEGAIERNILKKFADASPEQYQFLERMRLIKRFIHHGLRERISTQSPVRLAVDHGDYYAVKALLASQFKDVIGAFTLALRHDDPVLVQELMSAQSQEDIAPADKEYLREDAQDLHADETMKFLQSLDNQLLEAAERGDHDRVVRLLQQGAYPDVQDQLGTTPMMHAAQHGHLLVLQDMIDYEADPDLQNNDGATALIIAALNNKPDIVVKLIKHDAQLEIQDNSGKAFFDYADLYPETSSLQKTIRKELSMLQFEVEIRLGNMEKVQELLVLYPSFIDADLQGNKPLIVALLYSKQDIVRFLLTKGADPRSWSEDGKQALAIAIRSRQLQSMIALLEAGAYIDVPEDDGTTLQQLVTALNDPPVTQLFEFYVARRDAILKAFAGRSAKNEVMQILQQAPGLTMVSDSEGNTLLMLALKHKYMKIAEYLLAHGAQINRGNKQGATALMQAAGAGVEHVIRFILEHGGAIDQQDNRGWTALTYALANNQIAAAQLLLIRGASLNLLDHEGQTLLQMFHDKPELLAVVRGVSQKRTAAERHAQEVEETARLVALRNKIESDIAQNVPAENESGEKAKRQKLGT